MLCAVYVRHEEKSSVAFLVWPQNQGRRFLPIWPQNRWVRVFWFRSQNRQLRFGVLSLKITTMAFWFGSQNHVGYGLSVAPENRWKDEDSAKHASKSSGLLHLKLSQTRVSQSVLKIGGGSA
jgi:hypothetical protein